MRSRISYLDVMPYIQADATEKRYQAKKKILDTELSDQAKKVMAIKLKQSRYMRYREAALYYCLGMSNIKRLAKESGATLHVGKCVLIDTEIFEKYIDSFRDE